LWAGAHNRVIVLNDPINLIDPYGLINWGQVGTGAGSLLGGGITLVAGGAVTAIGVAEFSGGPVGVLVGLHTIGLGGTLMWTGGGLAWFGVSNIWDGLFNDNNSDDPCEDAVDDRPHVIPYPIPTRGPHPTIDNPLHE